MKKYYATGAMSEGQADRVRKSLTGAKYIDEVYIYRGECAIAVETKEAEKAIGSIKLILLIHGVRFDGEITIEEYRTLFRRG